MKLRDLYVDFLVHWLNDGDLINTDAISAVGMKPTFGRIDTRGHMRKVWVITYIPNDFQYNLPEIVKIMMHKKYPEIRTITTKHCTPRKVPTTSETFKRMMKRSYERYKDNEEFISQFSETDQELGKDIRIGARKVQFKRSKVDAMKNEAESYMYVHKHVANGGKFMRTTMTIEAIAKDKKLLNSYKKELITLLRSQNIKFREIQSNTSLFMENYGVTSYLQPTKQLNTLLLSDENLAMNSHWRTMGLVGGSGILMGIDWMTKLPLMLNFFASSTAQINLVYGRTGSGKTNLCFQTALSLISEGVHCSAIDIKGSEWNMLKEYIPVTEISMGGHTSRFVNTMRLDDLNADSSNSKAYFELAVKGTTQLLATMVNLMPNEGNPRDLQDLLKHAATKVLHSHEVYADRPESFIHSRDIKLQELVPVLETLSKSETFKGTGKEILSRIVVDRCAMFLQPGSTNDNLFKNEITVGEIINSPMVVYSFGKNSDSMLDLEDSLRVFMVQFLDTKKQALRKAEKKHSAAFYEELQRCKQFGNLVEYIKHSVTGSRSNNVKLFLLINDLSSLDGGALEAVKSSITTKIIGVTNANDRKRLAEEYDCGEIMPLINKIADDERYRYCFAIDYDTGESEDPRINTKDRTIFKVVLPKDIQDSLRTTDLKED